MLQILGPVGILVLIGYAMGRGAGGLDTRTLSTVVVLVAAPALIFSSLTSLQLDPSAVLGMSGAAAVCLAISAALSAAILLLAGGSLRSFLPALMMPNSGNMGLPLVLLTFGEAGGELAVAYFVVVALAQHSIGMAIYAGSFRLGVLLRQPLIYAVIAVVVVLVTGVEVPIVLARTAEMTGGMMVPAMLLLLGTSLARLRVADLRSALILAVGRLGVGLVSAICVIWLLGLQGVPAGVVFLMATMPTAIVIHVFAERFGRDPERVVGVVVVSTLLTFACLPVLTWIALTLAGRGL
ncbi:AEC family transporter [Salipiger sp. 1_MG-2023]|uniref:AEC family transporter n=1 Tax=Salipiger sp. 1_MG-2023 TaxID=3062665 RepID=UPI0026E15806|nr:AEC family transporter [Salipiger sp. 1_MG-2023]MDO6585194.1 AEC family transporter [Salipiger sp. 1_MG-2023]